MLDRWIALDWPAALLPGVAGWHRWGVALGALAMDLLIVVVFSTATRMRSPRLWRRAHLLAYPLWALAVGHGLLVGTDAVLVRAVALASVAVVLAGLAFRLLHRPPPVAQPRRGPVGAGAGR